MKYSSLFLVVLLSLFVYIYTGQLVQFVSIGIFYIIGITVIRLFLKPNNSLVYGVYGFFFFIYGVLALLSQIELIHNIDTDYFIHNDASDAFFPHAMKFGADNKDNLIETTLLNPFFYDYPLVAFINCGLARIANTLHVENIRFFLRIYIFMISAIIPAIITTLLLEYKVNKKFIIKNVCIFGLVSYLYVTSTVFTRDIHVCLFYTLIFYILLQPSPHNVIFKFIILFLLCLGARPENGIYSIVFFLSYYLINKKNNINISFFVLLFLVAIVLMYGLRDVFDEAVDTAIRYQHSTSHKSVGTFSAIYTLPFPLNVIGVSIYMILMPLPIDAYIVGNGKSFLTLPFVLSPYLMLVVFSSSVWYIINRFKTEKKYSIALIVAILTFFVVSYLSPDIRRSFAVVPGLYMGYCLIRNKVSVIFLRKIKYIGWPLIAFVNLLFYLLVRVY